jgi:hypothetical protein
MLEKWGKNEKFQIQQKLDFLEELNYKKEKKDGKIKECRKRAEKLVKEIED